MSDDPVKKAFLEAAEIVSKLPKHLQEIAFNRALDHLLGKDAGNARSIEDDHSGRTRKDEENSGERLLAAIDRTQLSDIGSTNRVADRALKILQFVNDKLHIDGLTAIHISEILTKKFRLPVSQNAINMALDRETDTVNVSRSANGVKLFHLMAPGEDYLRQLRSGNAPLRQRKARIRSFSTRDAASSSTEFPRVNSEKKTTKIANKGTSGRPGPKSAISQLISAGYFSEGRLIAHVQTELKHNRGHTYSVQELAPALVRSLRDGSLKRTRNESGQYAYSAA